MTTEVRRPVGPLVALGLAVAIAIAAVAVALIGGDDVSATAVRVNTSEVSQKTFNAQLRSVASAIGDQGGANDSYVPSAAAAQLASYHVVAMLLQSDLDRRGVQVSEADRKQFARQNAEQLEPFSSSVRALLVDVNALQATWSAEVGGSNPDQALTRLVRRADVHVDPRYGYWSPGRAQVCPPTGCNGSESSAATGG